MIVLITLFESHPYDPGSIHLSVSCSESDRRILEMKTKVICGRGPFMGEGKTKTRTDFRDGNRSVILGPTGRSGNLILVALQLIARKIRAKD